MRTHSGLKYLLAGCIAIGLYGIGTSTVRAAPGDLLSIPIRWCAIEGTPVAKNPGIVNESSLDHALWRRHERASEHIFIPQANVTLRSSITSKVKQNANFPVIKDPNPNSGQRKGDLVLQNKEWEQAINECRKRWNDKGIGDLGFLAIHAYRVLSSGSNIFGHINSQGEIVLRDHASRFTDPKIPRISGILGHEAGHGFGLEHNCDPQNVMTGAQNTDLKRSVLELLDDDDYAGPDGKKCSGDEVESSPTDQIATIRKMAPNIPGCKIRGTNQDCTRFSDARPDAIEDVFSSSTDMTNVTTTRDDNTQLFSFAHKTRSPVPRNLQFREELRYYVFADTDSSQTTGGSPRALGVPTNFTGVDLVTRVTVEGPEFQVDKTVWQFGGGTFRKVSHPDIAADVQAVEGISLLGPFDARSDHRADRIVIKFPTALVKTPRSLRIQALTEHIFRRDLLGPRDRLDERDPPPGLDIDLSSPEFPVCSVRPNRTLPGSTATVRARGLRANSKVNVVFGDDRVAVGSTDSQGNARISFQVPLGATMQRHLVTVGNQGTALTADCTVEVVESLQEPVQ